MHHHSVALEYKLESRIINENLLITVNAWSNAHGVPPTKLQYFAKITSKNMSIEIPKPYYSVEVLAQHLRDKNNYRFDAETQSLEIKFSAHNLQVEVQMFVQASSLVSEIVDLKKEIKSIK